MINAARLTQKEVNAAFDACLAMTEAIRQAGEIPSGTLYASVTGVISLEVYERCVRVIINSGLVTQKGHMLTWVGPDIAKGGE